MMYNISKTHKHKKESNTMMVDNESKLKELEERIDKFQDTLNEIKEALTKQICETCKQGDTIQNKVCTKESKLTSRERAKIEDIMENFNFDKVHKIMTMLDWKWAMTANGVPSMDELRAEAKRLLIDAAVERTCVATGGFRAVYESDGSDDPYIGLEFIVEECEGFVDDEDDDDHTDGTYPSPWARGGAAE